MRVICSCSIVKPCAHGLHHRLQSHGAAGLEQDVIPLAEDGFQVVGISTVGDADLNDLAEGNTIWNYKDY